MNWNDEIQAANDDDSVVAAINEFLARQDERFWSRVPARIESVAEPAEIHRWHHDLVQALKRAKPVPPELQELCVLFLRASVRLHQIDLRDPSRARPSNDELDCAAAPRRSKWPRQERP